MRYIRIENINDPTDFDVCKVNEGTYYEDITNLIQFAEDIKAEVKIKEITEEQYYFTLNHMEEPQLDSRNIKPINHGGGPSNNLG